MRQNLNIMEALLLSISKRKGHHCTNEIEKPYGKAENEAKNPFLGTVEPSISNSIPHSRGQAQFRGLDWWESPRPGMKSQALSELPGRARKFHHLILLLQTLTWQTGPGDRYAVQITTKCCDTFSLEHQPDVT